MEIIQPSDEIDVGEVAEQLKFLTELILLHIGKAIGAELAIWLETGFVDTAIVELGLAELAIGGDRAQIDLVRCLPTYMNSVADESAYIDGM